MAAAGRLEGELGQGRGAGAGEGRRGGEKAEVAVRVT